MNWEHTDFCDNLLSGNQGCMQDFRTSAITLSRGKVKTKESVAINRCLYVSLENWCNTSGQHKKFVQTFTTISNSNHKKTSEHITVIQFSQAFFKNYEGIITSYQIFWITSQILYVRIVKYCMDFKVIFFVILEEAFVDLKSVCINFVQLENFKFKLFVSYLYGTSLYLVLSSACICLL